MKTFFAVNPGNAKDTFLTEENIRLAQGFGEVRFGVPSDGKKMTASDVAEQIGDAEVCVTCWGSPRLDDTILDRAPSLRLLTHLCGTVVPVTSDAVWQRGIRVISGNDFFAESVGEGTIAYMLTALRDIPAYSRRLKEEKLWKKGDSYSEGLLGRTVGVVSYGAVARHLVRMLQPFRVKIKVYDIRPLPAEDKAKYGLSEASLDEIFSSCDIITVHTPLNDATRHLIGAELFAKIRPGALFVNTSRGAILDQKALCDALAGGTFRAILDVYEDKEPPLPDSPLYTLPNVYMMPHMAGPTVDLRKYIAENLIRESAGFVDGGAALPHEVSFAAASVMSRR